MLGPPTTSTVTVDGLRNVYLKTTVWTLTPLCSNIVIVALYAVVAAHAVLNALNAGDERDAEEASVRSAGIKRLPQAAASMRNLFKPESLRKLGASFDERGRL